MRPPNYRSSDGEKHGMIVDASCGNCRYSRQVGELGTVCVSYFALVLLTRICDSWDGGEIRMLDPQDASITIRYLHDPSATPEEREIIARAELSDMCGGPEN